MLTSLLAVAFAPLALGAAYEGAIHPLCSNLCIDVRGGVFAPGTPVQLWECNGTPAQWFRFLTKRPSYPRPEPIWAGRQGGSWCLTIPKQASPSETVDGAPIIIDRCEDVVSDINRRWSPSNHTGWWQYSNTNGYMTLKDGKRTPGTPLVLQLNLDPDNPDGYWKVDESGWLV